MEEKIEKIDTAQPMKISTIGLCEKVLELQEKLNEVIDMLNIMAMPDEDEVDDPDDIVLLSASETEISAKQKKKGK